MSYYLMIYLMYINTYIYNCIYNFVFFVYCNIVATHTHTAAHWSHWFHIHIIFLICFYLIVVTSRNSLTNCEHDPSYQ